MGQMSAQVSTYGLSWIQKRNSIVSEKLESEREIVTWVRVKVRVVTSEW